MSNYSFQVRTGIADSASHKNLLLQFSSNCAIYWIKGQQDPQLLKCQFLRHQTQIESVAKVSPTICWSCQGCEQNLCQFQVSFKLKSGQPRP
ncbi:hypothetical protein JTE90_022398, partial [Oedothorax gibbosus]